MLAYTDGNQYEVVTWYELTEPDDTVDADQWFLTCMSFSCQYEEQVERVAQPMGAILFDLQQSHYGLDEHCGIFSMRPPDLMPLIQHLKALCQLHPSRKLTSLLEEAEFQEKYQMEDLRTWINQVSDGERIRFVAADQELTGRLLAVSGDRFLLLTEPDDTLLGIELETVGAYGMSLADRPTVIRLDGLILLHCNKEMVVVRGYHLQLCHVDRLGMHHVRCWDGVTASALGLTEVCPGYWEGAFRRTDIQASYDSKKMLRVKGHWVEVYGQNKSEHPAIKTEDPAVAEALGLTGDRYLGDPEDQPITRWSGTVTWDQVEEQDEVRVYHDEPSSTGSGD